MAVYLKPNTRINEYKIVDLLSSGGEGTTYLAQGNGRQRVVLKQFNFSASDKRNRGLYERVERHRELKSKKHPHVAEIRDIFVHEDLMYEVCEHIDGHSLADAIGSRGKLSICDAVQVGDDLLSGLDWLHGQSIIHRDIKPGNFVLFRVPKKDAHGKIIDLGIALFCDKPRLTIGTAPGTYAYAPPEFFNGKHNKIDARSDLYSVGVTLYEAVSGRLPYSDESLTALFRSVLSGDRPALRTIVKDIPGTLETLIDKLLQPEQFKRFDSAQDARIALREALPDSFLDRTPLGSPKLRKEDGDRRDHVKPNLVLEIQAGILMARRIVVPESGICLGRSLLNPDDSKISRFHARAELKKGGLWMVDLDTPNGLIYRGERCRKVRLTLGETVVIGATPLVFGLDKP